MRWFYDERLGRNRQVVRVRPIRLASGHPGVRVELRFEEGLSKTQNITIMTEKEYQTKVSSSGYNPDITKSLKDVL